MPSASLLSWQVDRISRLVEVEKNCTAAAVLAPPNVFLAEESLRGLVTLLSGHFQGYCRDLYTECVQVFASKALPDVRATIQAQFCAELKINSNNPTVETIRKDFERFAFTLDFGAEPANRLRLTHLGHLNKWRNIVAHQKPGVPLGLPPLTLSEVQGWRASCDGLAIWLDAIMYQELHRIFGFAPW